MTQSLRRTTLVFDLDGTLVDSAPDIAAAVNALFAELSLPEVELALIRRMIGDGAPVLLEHALAHVLFGQPGVGTIESKHDDPRPTLTLGRGSRSRRRSPSNRGQSAEKEACTSENAGLPRQPTHREHGDLDLLKLWGSQGVERTIEYIMRYRRYPHLGRLDGYGPGRGPSAAGGSACTC